MKYPAIIATISLLMALIGHHVDMIYGKRMSLNPDSTTPEEKQMEYLITETLQENVDKLKTPKYQTLEIRLPSNTLLKYTSYKDVSILHFRVPPDTRQAIFSFKASEESKSTFHRKCKAQDVTLHLKASSFPVISPENITFPSNFLNSNQRFKIYSKQFKSDEVQQRITVNGPQMTDWYAVAFLSWTDPNNDRIEQQGLAPSCETQLMAEMSVTHFYPIIINKGQTKNNTLTLDWSTMQNPERESGKSPEADDMNTVNGQNSSMFRNISNDNFNSPLIKEVVYKFYVPRNVGVASAYIKFAQVCSECPFVGFHMQANAFPSVTMEAAEANETIYTYSTYIKANSTDEIPIAFNVQPMVWHYILLKFVTDQNINLTSTKLPLTSKESPFSELLSQGLGFLFRIDYLEAYEDSDNVSSSVQANLTNKDKSFNAWKPRIFRDIEFYPLLRQTYREFFTFDFDLMPDENGTVPALLNLTSGNTAGFSFSVGEVCDIGGTLSFSISMKDEDNTSDKKRIASEENGVLEENLGGVVAALQTNESQWLPGVERAISDSVSSNRTNQTIIICMHYGEPAEPTWPDKCRYHGRLLPASSIIKRTVENSKMGLIHVPFPESGQWYITMDLYCHGAETAAHASIIESVKEFVKQHAYLLESMPLICDCGENATYYRDCVTDSKCLAAMNETEALKIKECLTNSKCTSNHLELAHKFKLHQQNVTGQQFAKDNCSASVEFTISSSPCIGGKCGRFGKCFHYMSGGFVFSTCVCTKGYRGWDCSEDSQVPSSISILIASIMLIFSNFLFIPSIYTAARRSYFTEAVIYSFSMFFSIFYHACDSGEDVYSFCLVRLGVLQFCDFYCGLLAIWVTLVAMSHIRQQFVSLLHMFGAIMLAFATELNKQSLWAFLAPALTGLCLISTSWGLRCYKSRKWFPARKYLTIYMPIGCALTMVGLVCYAFLQTKENYYIVHSIWHMVMALSILCLLPSPKSFIPES